MRVVQLAHRTHGRRVALVDEPNLKLLRGPQSLYELVQSAIQSGQSLSSCVEQLATDELLPYDDVYSGRSEWRLMSPIDHLDPSHCLVTGTGLTHKASAENRQSMHVAEARAPGDVKSLPLTDSMKMFRIGMEGGRPAPGSIGAAPEWFYKGVGTIVCGHNERLRVPSHGLDGGEEAEIAGIYLIGSDGTPFRIGLAQGNEFSDHVMESKNYLYLAPSKLRDCALGPEIVIDPKFDDVLGETTIERKGEIIWRGTQATGERWMCHTLANIEHHHFKYAEHRRPGDVHIHFFGADMFSFKDRLRLEDGDVMVISFEGFGRPLRNALHIDDEKDDLVTVKVL